MNDQEDDVIYYKEHGNTQDDDWILPTPEEEEEPKMQRTSSLLPRQRRNESSNNIVFEWAEQEEKDDDDDDDNAFASLQRDLYPIPKNNLKTKPKSSQKNCSSPIVTLTERRKLLPLDSDDDDDSDINLSPSFPPQDQQQLLYTVEDNKEEEEEEEVGITNDNNDDSMKKVIDEEEQSKLQTSSSLKQQDNGEKIDQAEMNQTTTTKTIETISSNEIDNVMIMNTREDVDLIDKKTQRINTITTENDNSTKAQSSSNTMETNESAVFENMDEVQLSFPIDYDEHSPQKKHHSSNNESKILVYSSIITSPQESTVLSKARYMASKRKSTDSIKPTTATTIVPLLASSSSSQYTSNNSKKGKLNFQPTIHKRHKNNNTKERISIQLSSSSIVGSRPAHWNILSSSSSLNSRYNKNRTIQSLQTTTTNRKKIMSTAKKLSQITKAKTMTMMMKSDSINKQTNKISSFPPSLWQQKMNSSNLNFGPAFLSSSSSAKRLSRDDLTNIDEDDDENHNHRDQFHHYPPRLFHSPSKTSNKSSNQYHLDTFSTPRKQLNNDIHQNSGHGSSSSTATIFNLDSTISPTNLWPQNHHQHHEQQQPEQYHQRRKKQKIPAGQLVQRWKQYHSSLQRSNIRLQSNTYPFTTTPSRNDPRSSFKSYIDITILCHLQKYNNNNQCNNHCQNQNYQPCYCSGTFAYIHQYHSTEKTQSSKINASVTSPTLTNNVAWIIFNRDTIRKQKIIPNSLIRVYDSMLLSLECNNDKGCQWLVLCTKLCEPLPSTTLPKLPKIDILAR